MEPSWWGQWNRHSQCLGGPQVHQLLSCRLQWLAAALGAAQNERAFHRRQGGKDWNSVSRNLEHDYLFR